MAAVRPPAYGTLRVGDQPAASALRVVTGWHATSSAQMFQLVQAGWVGIEPATVVMVEHFMLTYIKQLGHENPRVRTSTQKGLWQAFTKFHVDMPCYQAKGSLTAKSALSMTRIMIGW